MRSFLLEALSISTNNISSLIAVLALEPTTLGLRVRILMPLKFAAIKRKQTLDSVCFYSGGRI